MIGVGLKKTGSHTHTKIIPKFPPSPPLELPLLGSTGIIQLFGHCIATWNAMTRSHVKLTEIGTSCGRGVTVTQKPIHNYCL